MTVYIQGKPVGEVDLGMSYLERGQPAFAVLTLPRAIPDSKSPPRKRGPRPSKHYQTLTAFETPEERKARHKAEKEAKILRKNPYSDISRSFPTQADRTNQIRPHHVGQRV